MSKRQVEVWSSQRKDEKDPIRLRLLEHSPDQVRVAMVDPDGTIQRVLLTFRMTSGGLILQLRSDIPPNIGVCVYQGAISRFVEAEPMGGMA